MSSDPELFSFGWAGGRRHPRGWRGCTGGQGLEDQPPSPLPSWVEGPAAASERRGWRDEETGEKNHRETSDVKITESSSQALLPRRRLIPGPRSLQPTQALRRLPSQITLIALQIASRIRCSFQLNWRLSISILFGEFKWRAYSYRWPGYGVRKGVAIAHSETKRRSVNLRNQRGELRERAGGRQLWEEPPWRGLAAPRLRWAVQPDEGGWTPAQRGERGRCRGWLARRGCPQTSRSPTWGTRTRAPQPVLGGTGGVSLRGTLRHGTAVTQPRKWEPGASGAEAAPRAPAGERARLPGHNRSWGVLPGVFSYRQHHGPKSPPFRSTFWREF